MKRFVQSAVTVCLLFACCLAALLAAAIPARADDPPSATPDQQVWVTNGAVRAIAPAPDGTTYIGGEFTYVGPNTGGAGALDATSGDPDMTFAPVAGTVDAAVTDGAGGYYIGGDFTAIGGVTRNDIAHILPDGSVDPAFDPDASDSVLSLAVSGSIVYAGGDFTSIGGQTRNHIAALDASSGLVTTWDPNADKEVDALVVSGSTVYVGGWFTSIGGQNRTDLAAVDATSGLATSWNPSPDRAVDDVVVSGSTVYAVGFFTSIGGQNRSEIAALDATTGLATAWDPSASGASYHELFSLAVSGSTVYVGGEFDTIGGQTRGNLAALDATSGLATAWDPEVGGPSYPVVNALALSGSTLTVGGDFATICGQEQPCLARFSVPVPPTVTSPNGGESWTLGSTHDVTWDAGNGGNVTIELSRDGGSTWETLLASTENDGSAPWTVGGPTASDALVRISNDKGSGSSTASFAIAPALTGSLSLDGGAAYATSTAVTIDSSVAGVTQMRLENDGGSWSAWEPYADGAAWTLLSGDGAKTVDAQYRDADGNVLGLSAGITLDATAPVTTDDAPSGWKHASVTVHLSPTDAGSGMSGGSAATEYSTDGGADWTTGTSVTVSADPLAHTTDGITTISYHSSDAAGNAEATRTCQVKLDTRAPTTKALWRASARRGGTATLKYRVTDPSPNGGTATVTIKVKNHTGKIVKTLHCGVKVVNSTLTVRFMVPRTWKAGTYHFSVTATDSAGNAQASAGSNKFIVK